MAINSGLDDAESVRLTMMALPILAKAQHGSSYINDIELKMKFEQSMMHTFEYLYNLIPADELKLTDKWFYLCCQAAYSSTDVISIESLIAELQQGENNMPHLNAVQEHVLLDLDLEDNRYVTLKKTILDMPYMTHLQNNKQKAELVYEFLQKSLMHFHRLAVIKLRQNGSGSNDSEITWRRKLRA
jgi:hypothetical protein